MTDASQPGPSGSSSSSDPSSPNEVPVWAPVLFAGLAGGLGWGIRGQYGHETGAMIAGLLLGLVITCLFGRLTSSLAAARTVAWCTVAIGFGGSMTYGQTIGLTQNPAMIGNWEALRWGMLGLALKGGLWIGFAGVFLGMGLGGARYRAREMMVVFLVLLGLFFAGKALLNAPFDPVQRLLPRIYFSADWRWEPGAQLKPRPEVWGGLLAAWIALTAYVGVRRRDRLAAALALWGFAGGAIGFPAGQSLQAFHAWNSELFRSGFLASIDPLLNWWNFMETTFGAIAGATLGLGVWWHRQWIARASPEPPVTLGPGWEWVLALVHALLLAASEFDVIDLPLAGLYTELGLLLGFLPVAAIAAGRWWPYLLAFPITLLPIAGKTLRYLFLSEGVAHPLGTVFLRVILPLVLLLGLAIRVAALFVRRGRSGATGEDFAAGALPLVTWLYFILNYAFFRFPWPWEPWTIRTPNAMVFFACAVGLTWLAWRHRPGPGTARQPPNLP